MGIKHLVVVQKDEPVKKVLAGQDLEEMKTQIASMFIEFPFEEAYKEGWTDGEILKAFEIMSTEFNKQMDLFRKKLTRV